MKKGRHRTLSIVVALVTTISLSTAAFAVDDNKIEDEKIVRALESELFNAKAVDGNAIDVKSDQGIITLDGTARTVLAKDRAVRVAQMTKGVRSVIDRIQVKAAEVSDDVIAMEVATALAADPATDSWEIKVTTSNGQVNLDGKVDSYAERQLAGLVAKSVRGVNKVENNIVVQYATLRSDAEIKNEIEQRLNWDVRLDDELVNVAVEGGAVTLEGTVGSDYERVIARGDAWVSGVKSVADEKLDVEWWSRDKMQRNTAWKDLSDEQIRAAVNKALLYDPRVFSFNPTVTVESGVVTLSGMVDNLKAKRAAAQDAGNTVGVWEVKNLLKVRPDSVRPDDQIKRDIAAAMNRDSLINRYEANIYVNGGEVSLYGDVDSYFEKAHMEDVAAKVAGVTDVNNYMDVSYDPPMAGYTYYDWDPILYDYDFDYQTTLTKSDRKIEGAIQSELWWSPWVTYDQVKIEVENGVATLTGTVDSWMERKMASENALEGGAVKVINNLSVDYD